MVRALGKFVADTAGCAANSDSSAYQRFIPDLVVTGDPAIDGLVEVKTTALALADVAQGIRREATAKYIGFGVDPGHLHVLVFDVRGDCDGPTQRYLRKLTRVRALRGTADGRDTPGVRALLGRALARTAVLVRAEYRSRLGFRVTRADHVSILSYFPGSRMGGAQGMSGVPSRPQGGQAARSGLTRSWSFGDGPTNTSRPRGGQDAPGRWPGARAAAG